MAIEPVYYDKQYGFTTNDGIIADPGNAGAISPDQTGTVPLVTTGAETRTLAVPTRAGVELHLYFQTAGGDCVITVTGGVNYVGHNTITLAVATTSVKLSSMYNGSTYRWQIVWNDIEGAATAGNTGLSTV